MILGSEVTETASKAIDGSADIRHGRRVVRKRDEVIPILGHRQFLEVVYNRPARSTPILLMYTDDMSFDANGRKCSLTSPAVRGIAGEGVVD